MADPFIPLADDFWVAPQLTADDVRAAAERGVELIVNNRPDGEEPGQPSGAEIEAAATAAGLAYAAIPVDASGVGAGHLDAFDAARAARPGLALGYCRTGTRSTIVRALAAARAGRDIDEIVAEAGRAGYDIAARRPMLEAAAKAGA